MIPLADSIYKFRALSVHCRKNNINCLSIDDKSWCNSFTSRSDIF